MKYLLSFAFFALAAHTVDAARHYWKEDESFSFALNASWGVITALIAISLLLVDNM